MYRLVAALSLVFSFIFFYQTEIADFRPIPISHEGRFIPLAVYERQQEQKQKPIHGQDQEDPDSFKARYAKLISQYPNSETALRLEFEFPLAERLQAAGDHLRLLPGKLAEGVWYSPHAFHTKVFNAATGSLELVGNFTLYDDDHFDKLRAAYFQLEEATILLSPYEDSARFNFLSLVEKGYRAVESKPYRKGSGKQLSYPSRGQLIAEEIYFHYPFIEAIIAFYGAAFLVLLMSSYFENKRIFKLGISLAFCGFILHTAILCLRTYILARPPVANMLETVIYVPWVAVALGLGCALWTKNAPPLAAASFVGCTLLALIKFFTLNGKLENVQAVLDSQYWLIIHVLMIVASYGVFILSSILGHAYLVLVTMRKPRIAKSLMPTIIHTIYLGTALLIGGTILGGVWAAESWGRFWDWDPKESWAFTSICVYLLWIHAYRYRLLGSFGLALGSVLGALMISFTWYGVNYILGTGFHSYGFGNGGQWIYYGYLFAELLFVATMATIAWQQGFWNNRLAE